MSNSPTPNNESELDAILDHLGERCIMHESGLTDRPRADEIQVAKNRLFDLISNEIIGEDPYYDDEDAYAEEKRAIHSLKAKQRNKLIAMGWVEK